MFEKEITRDSEKVLGVLFTEYKNRRKQKISKSEAIRFNNSDSVHDKYFPNENTEDIFDFCMELKSAELVTGIRADGTLYTLNLSDKGIVYMENKPKEFFSDIIKIIDSLKI